MNKNQLFLPQRTDGTYRRCLYADDVIYGFFRHREIELFFPKKKGQTARFTDRWVDCAAEKGLISPCKREEYVQRIKEEFPILSAHHDASVEELYSIIEQIRLTMLGEDLVEELSEIRLQDENYLSKLPQGIFQEAKRKALLEQSDSILFVLAQREYFPYMEKDLQLCLRAGKKVLIAVSPDRGHSLPSKEFFTDRIQKSKINYLSCKKLQGDLLNGITLPNFEKEKTSLFFYGEEGILQCRSLAVDSFVTAYCEGYQTAAVAGQLGNSSLCGYWIPQGWDVTQYVPLTTKTILNLNHLAQIQLDFDTTFDSADPVALYTQYPQYFFNRYAQSTPITEASKDFPIKMPVLSSENSLEEMERKSTEEIKSYTSKFEGFSFSSHYFNDDLSEAPIPVFPKEKQNGILVHCLKISKAKGAKIIPMDQFGVRKHFEALGKEENGFITNFLFFLTPKLIALHQDLRKDRPYEQSPIAAEHLDYMLNRSQNGKRIESFPLFRKMCIAMDEDGAFRFFNFRLGGGQISVNDHSVSWNAENVDPCDPDLAPVCVFTPLLSQSDRDADRETYRKTVGEGRVNFVIVKDRILSVRRGNVVLPAMGVVISLHPNVGNPLLSSLKGKELNNGYVDPQEWNLSIHLDPPEGFSNETWDRICWAWGGGMSLILDGKAISDQEDPDAWFDREGWMSPLSRQTQESALHLMVRHPRTAIGITDQNELVVLVFSGRTSLSHGANYNEMCRITRKIFPNVKHLMNADGGGSAVMGMVTQGSFQELSYPSTSTGSCAGMIRPIKTVLYLPFPKQ